MYRALHRSLALVTVVGCQAAPPAAALDTSFATAEHGLASTAPDAKSLVEHTARAVALAAGASDGERLMILALRAHANADTYLRGTETRHNSVRLRQAHELNGLVALNDRTFDIAVREFALADQQNPAVLYGAAQAWQRRHHPRHEARRHAARPCDDPTSRRAMNMLTDSAVPVTRVAYDSGFQSLRRFNAAFRARFAMSPSEWRKRDPLCR